MDSPFIVGAAILAAVASIGYGVERFRGLAVTAAVLSTLALIAYGALQLLR